MVIRGLKLWLCWLVSFYCGKLRLNMVDAAAIIVDADAIVVVETTRFDFSTKTLKNLDAMFKINCG